eukprot:7416742-Alexandrium_andersonii.AAC.1
MSRHFRCFQCGRWVSSQDLADCERPSLCHACVDGSDAQLPPMRDGGLQLSARLRRPGKRTDEARPD